MNSCFNTITAVSLLISLVATPGCASPKAQNSASSFKTASSAKMGKGLSRIGHAIQMGAFSDVKNAERFTARLQSKGIEAFYFRRDNGIYAVRFGDFPTKEKARAAALRLEAEGLISGFYIAPPNEIVFTGSKEPVIKKNLPELRQPPPTRQTRTNELGLPVDDTPAIKQPGYKNGERDMGYIAARTAERFVGIPYQWGGDTVVDGMDCSGFVRAVYNLCGINIPRTSRDQYKAGNPVEKNELRDGDLIFFGSSPSSINHVGIYVGEGKFVHAPKRGEDIKTAAVDESYFERRFVGARRYFQ